MTWTENEYVEAPPIRFWEPLLAPASAARIQRILDINYLNDGDEVETLERAVAERVGTKHAVAVTSGTAALFASLAALEVGPGDEVIVPDVTFIATAHAVTWTGAAPIPVDIDPMTLTMCPKAAERAITTRTKAIVPVHVSGRAADMPAILDIAQRHGLHIVEDAAEALTSRRFGRCLGAFGQTGCFSFSPNKTISTGQGGCIVTNDSALNVRLRELKDQGRPVRGTGGDDEHPRIGFNLKFTNLQAAVGLAQLSELDQRTQRARELHALYREALGDVAGVRLLPFATDEGECPQWTDALVTQRDDLDARLRAQNIHCRRFWHPIHRQPAYRRPDDEFPHSTRLTREALWLPSALTLTDADVTRVCELTRRFLTTAEPVGVSGRSA